MVVTKKPGWFSNARNLYYKREWSFFFFSLLLEIGHEYAIEICAKGKFMCLWC